VSSVVSKLVELNIAKNAGEISIAVPLYLGMSFLHQNFDAKIVYLGQGADELFGGYNKYSILASKSEMITVEKTMGEDLDKLQNRQIKMERQIANLFEIDLIYPFLYPELIERAHDIPISDHFVLVNGNKPIGKLILRKLATFRSTFNNQSNS